MLRTGVILCLTILRTCFCRDFVVNTTIGLVRGYPASDGDYIKFLGIPYGKVDASNPFGVASPHPRFDKIFEAIDDSAICPQREEFNHTIVGTLDCLHLNIHVPSSANPDNLRPVFVWIYGGEFNVGFFGRYLYGPKFLTRHDVVVVSFNYRVGPYGFMSIDTPEIPGNQGLKDQVLALRWIQDNIAAFGGDPNKVTIAGNSAGGVSADFHILRVNNGPPLFHQAVLQSGTSYLSAPDRADTKAPLLMAANLGFATTNVEDAVWFLAQRDPSDVIAASLSSNIMYNIVIEKEFEGVEPFITENWFHVREIFNIKNMPILIGFNSNEGALIDTIMEPDPIIVPSIMRVLFNSSYPDFADITQSVQNFYHGAGENDDFKQQIVDFLSDSMFVYPIFRTLNRVLQHGVGNLYLYEFAYKGGRNFVQDRENVSYEGAIHADEIGYLFDISYMEDPTAQDQAVVDSMTLLWANFIKHGDPTPQTSALLPHKWHPITPHSPHHYMKIDQQLSVGTRPLHERMTFWELLYHGYGHLERNVTRINIRKNVIDLIRYLKQ